MSQHMFDPWLTCSNLIARAVADNLLCAWDQMQPPRKRAMKAADRETLRAIVHALTANFAYAASLGVSPPAFGVSLRAEKQANTRYDRPGFKGLARVLRILAAPEVGLIRLDASEAKGIASTATSLAIFVGDARTLRAVGRDASKFGRLPERETIYLSRKSRDYANGLEKRELIDYRDSPEADRFRAEVAGINAFLATADIGCEPDGGPPIGTSVRALRRYFSVAADAPEGTERFDRNGRLFGGWWQSLPSSRRPSIRLQGEPVADLDFASMFLRLAYIRAGLTPPDGDLYASVPGFEGPQWRPGLKTVTLAMLSRTSPLQKFPKGTRELFPGSVSAGQVRAAVLAAHAPIAAVFEAGAGPGLMFLESAVMVAALQSLATIGVPALPMHDGVMVPRSRAERAMGAMGDAAEAVTGHRLPVAVKATY